MGLHVSEHERELLKQLAREAEDVRLLRRVQALLDLDSGESPQLVSRRYQVARSPFIIGSSAIVIGASASRHSVIFHAQGDRASLARVMERTAMARHLADPSYDVSTPLKHWGWVGTGVKLAPETAEAGAPSPPTGVPSRRADTAAWVRLVTPSLRMMCRT